MSLPTNRGLNLLLFVHHKRRYTIMDSGIDTPEIENEIVQPDEVVVTDSEATEATPQAEATEQEELYIEGEADQEQAKTSMTKEQSYAAFKKEKAKRQRKNEQLEAEKVERERLQRELEELKSTVGKIAKGKPPSLDQFDYDEDQYQKAVREYYSEPKAESKPSVDAQPQQSQSNDEADFYLYQQEQELAKKMPQYTDHKNGFIEKLTKQYNEPDTDNAIAFLSDIARHKKVDIAKAITAMNASPALIGELYAANNNPIIIGDILAKAAGKVKTRSHKPIDTQPEPSINNSGPIDNSAGTVAKLRAQWVKDKSTASYNAYMKAKKRQGEQ